VLLLLLLLLLLLVLLQLEVIHWQLSVMTSANFELLPAL
jgi:hypothetical protein